MKRVAWLAAGLGMLLGLAVPARAAARASAPTELRVFAAASLGDAIGEIARAFERDHAGVRVRLVLAGSQQLVGQLAQGAAGDVLATADERNMDDARQRGLVAGAPSTFARNRLALVVPATNPGRLRTWRDLERRGLKLVIGAEAVPVGRYTRELFARLGASAGGEWTRRVLDNVVSQEENVKSVLAKVQMGEADAGVVYRTDVSPALSRYVRALELPEGASPVTSYPVAVLERSPHAELARAFVAAVLSAAGRAALERRGFLPPGGTP